MGGIEDRLREIDTGKTPPTPLIKSELEKALEEEEAELAKELRRGRAEELIAKHQVRIKELRDQLGKGGANVVDEEKKREDAKRMREEISTTAILLLEKGMDPKVVAQYISGSTPVTPITLAPSAPGAQGLTIDDVIKIMNLSTEGKGTTELKQTLEALNVAITKLGAGNTQGPPDPIAFAKHQAQLTQAYVNTLKELGVITEPVVTTAGGQSIEVVREEHRHKEKMEEISVDKVYKGKLGEAVASLPEKIGRGLGSQITEEGSEGREDESGGLEYIDCTEEGCGQRIFITPETGHQITCPGCGAIYERKAPVEPKSKAPAATKKGK